MHRGALLIHAPMHANPQSGPQANNAYIFPAVGHAAVLAEAKTVPEVRGEGLGEDGEGRAARKERGGVGWR